MNDRYKTELLDYLEGSLPEAWRRTLEADPEFRRQLARLAQVRSEIAAMPDESPPAWSAISGALEERARKRRRRSMLAGLSIAASVMVAVFVATEQAPAPDDSRAQVDQLIATSQTLERLRLDQRAREANWTTAQRGIAIRIADVDDEIGSLGDRAVSDADVRRGLWQRRVDLMRSLVDSERGRFESPVIL